MTRGLDLVLRSPLNSVQMPAKASSARSSLSANHTTSFFFVPAFGSGADSAKLLAGTKASVLRLEPSAPMRRRRVADVGDRRPAGARWWRHAPPHHAQLALGTCGADDGSKVVREDAGQRRQVADVAVRGRAQMAS